MIDWTCYRAGDRRCYAYLTDPAKLDTVERCQMYDQTAARYLEELEAEIEAMKQYRQEVFSRMRLLYSAPSQLKITLTRERRYQANVYYILAYWREYIGEDIPPKLEQSTRYEGRQRQQAIADYKAAVKAHPGVACEMDITRKPWEK